MNPASRQSRGRGYTILEVMIALTLITVGVSGVVAMQKVTAVANRDARNLAIANELARTWLDRLRTDAIAWNQPGPSAPGSSDLVSDTVWLGLTGDVVGWFQPDAHPTRGGAAFDVQGMDISNTPDRDASFCTHLRLEWIYGPYPTQPAPYLIRADVRVFWLRDGGGGLLSDMTSLCDPNADAETIGRATDNFRFVYATSAIKQNPL